MRPEMVANGVKFLRHPNVQATPLSERVAFLEQKGLTKEEIDHAMEQYQTETPPQVAQAAVPVLPNQMMMPSRPPPSILWMLPPYMRLFIAISSLFGAASIISWLWNYAVNAGFFPWLKSKQKRLEAAANEEKQEEKQLLENMTQVSQAIEAQTAEFSKLCVKLDEKEHESRLNDQLRIEMKQQSTAQAIAELKAEVKTLKTLLMAKESNGNDLKTIQFEENATKSTENPTKSDESIQIEPSVVVPPVLSSRERADRVENAIRLLQKENASEQLKAASGILTMYVKNLVENPDVPRYRRIARGNTNFKQKIEPLKHHDAFLQSIGFETNGLNMEWKWHTHDKEDNLAILRAVLRALQSIGKETTENDLGDVVQHDVAQYFDQDKVEDEELEEKAPAPPSTDQEAHDLNAFMAKLQQKTSIKPVQEEEATEKDNDGPVYPQSFAQVMEMVQRGEKVPGIQDIEEKLSVDASTLLQSTTTEEEAPAKPWTRPPKPLTA